MLKKLTEKIGAALLASALLVAGWLAVHCTPPAAARGEMWDIATQKLSPAR